MRLLAPALLAGLLACPAAAAARTPQPLVALAPQTTVFADRVITRAPVRAHAAAAPRAYAAPDGTSILVRFSEAYTPDDNVAQTYVNYLGQLPHGSELSRIKLLLAPPKEVETDCGGGEGQGVLACYDATAHEMVVPGEQIESSSGVSTSYVITHEYGHHIAFFRNNSPFSALAFGPKYWSSYEKVCDRTLAGRLVPGAEGTAYALNPGESWAETYARLVYPDEPWRFTRLLKPDAGALAAARRDVSDPWTQATTRTFEGTFAGGGADVRHFSFPLTLDGALKVRLSGPSRARYDLGVSSLGQTRGRTRGHAARDRLSWKAACRQLRNERVTVTVSRRSGAGAFRLAVTYAG